MKKNYTILGIIGVMILIGLYVWNTETSYSSMERKTTATTPQSTSTETATSSTTSGATASFTLLEVKQHADATSCYSAINGNVYDLTAWVDKHPAGRLKILLICGKDGSTLFNLQHGGKQKEADILARYKIGVLLQ